MEDQNLDEMYLDASDQEPFNTGAVVGFFQGDLTVRSPEPEEQQLATGDLLFDPELEVSTISDSTNVRLNSETSNRSQTGQAATSGSCVTVPSEMSEEDQKKLMDKIGAVDSLLERALDIRKQLEKLDDPITMASVNEKVIKLRDQKTRLLEQLLEHEKENHRKISCALGVSHSQAGSQVQSEETGDLRNNSAIAVPQKVEVRRRQSETIQNTNLAESIGILRANLDDVLQRRAELVSVVKAIKSKSEDAGDDTEKIRLYDLVDSHMERIMDLDQTIEQARKTLTVMEGIHRTATQDQKAQYDTDSLHSDSDEPVDVGQMLALRERLKRLRGMTNFSTDVDVDHTSERKSSSAGHRQLPGPGNEERLEAEFQSLADHRGQDRPSSENLEGAIANNKPPPVSHRKGWLGGSENGLMGEPRRPYRCELNNAVVGQNRSSRYSMADWSTIGTSSRSVQPEHLYQPAAMFHEFRDLYEHHTESQEYPYISLGDARTSDSENEHASSFPQIQNAVGESHLHHHGSGNAPRLTVDKRNDLTKPTKKKSNSVNWKNGSRGDPRFARSAADRDQRSHVGVHTHEQDSHVTSGSQHILDGFRELAVPEVLGSLQVIMAEQQKILNTCVQYIAKPNPRATPDHHSQHQEKTTNPGRDILMINNASQFHGERSRTRSNDSVISDYFEQSGGVLNNQRLEGPHPVGIPAGSSVSRNRFEVNTGYEVSGLDGDGVERNYRTGEEVVGRTGRKRAKEAGPGKDVTGLIGRVVHKFSDDIGSLRYILESLAALETNTLRATVAAKIGLLVVSERSVGHQNAAPLLPTPASCPRSGSTQLPPSQTVTPRGFLNPPSAGPVCDPSVGYYPKQRIPFQAPVPANRSFPPWLKPSTSTSEPIASQIPSESQKTANVFGGVMEKPPNVRMYGNSQGRSAQLERPPVAENGQQFSFNSGNNLPGSQMPHPFAGVCSAQHFRGIYPQMMPFEPHTAQGQQSYFGSVSNYNTGRNGTVPSMMDMTGLVPQYAYGQVPGTSVSTARPYGSSAQSSRTTGSGGAVLNPGSTCNRPPLGMRVSRPTSNTGDALRPHWFVPPASCSSSTPSNRQADTNRPRLFSAPTNPTPSFMPSLDQMAALERDMMNNLSVHDPPRRADDAEHSSGSYDLVEDMQDNE